MEGDNKEVFFDVYCPTCKHKAENEDDPNSACFDCLEEPANQDSHKPVNWEKQEEKLPGEKNR